MGEDFATGRSRFLTAVSQAKTLASENGMPGATADTAKDTASASQPAGVRRRETRGC